MRGGNLKLIDPSDLLILNLVISDILNLISNIIPNFVTELNAVGGLE
jgi:hypothetical protein